MRRHKTVSLVRISPHLIENDSLKTVPSCSYAFAFKILPPQQRTEHTVSVKQEDIVEILLHRTCRRVQSPVRAGKCVHVCIA